MPFRLSALLASTLIAPVLLATTAKAVPVPAAGLEHDYVRARAAAIVGDPGDAAKRFADILKAVPGDRGTAVLLFRQAMLAGDRPLVERAAKIFAADSQPPADIAWLLLAQAIEAKQWKIAAGWADRLAGDPAFAFTSSVLQAWLGLANGNADPLALLQAGKTKGAESPYVAEHRAWLLLALGKKEEGVTAVRALADNPSARSVRLRLGAAAELVKLGDRTAAVALLQGEGSALARARSIVAAGGDLPGAVGDAQAGIAELMIRVAADAARERANNVALTLGRTATFLDPGNAETWLVTAEILGNLEKPDLALTALERIAPEDPLRDVADASRVQMLARADRRDEALAIAQAAAVRPEATVADHILVGDLLSALDRDREAAAAYGSALALAEKTPGRSDLWSIYLMRGGALEQAGDWKAAEADLAQAVRLAPEQPVALNYLGYAKLDRKEDVANALRMVEKASALAPDSAAITDSLGWGYYLTGNLPGAIVKLEAAAKAEPADPDINDHLGDAYWAAGRRLEARYAWRAAAIYAEGERRDRIRAKIDFGPSNGVTAQR
ncbi:hypothetical protein [Sphingomonas sp. ID0503]|uniref:hypothetical protein n=1 Tax=Sphingomonas sp. ID0503 TaxID=3399691 RepID=UPI003AFA9854